MDANLAKYGPSSKTVNERSLYRPKEKEAGEPSSSSTSIPTPAASSSKKPQTFEEKTTQVEYHEEKEQKTQHSTQTQAPETLSKSDSIDENIQTLKSQVELALKNIQSDQIENLCVGQTKISNDKAVILSWGKNTSLPQTDELADIEDDGLVLYVAIRYKKPKDSEDENNNADKLKIKADDSGSNEAAASAGDGETSDPDAVVAFTGDDDENPPPAKDGEAWAQSSDDIQKLPPATPSKSSKNLSAKRAKKNWQSLVTLMRDVKIEDCQDMFVKDEYSSVRVEEDDILELADGTFCVVTPTPSEEEETPSKKRVTWSEVLEDRIEADDEVLTLETQRAESPDGGRTPSRPTIMAQQTVEEIEDLEADENIRMTSLNSPIPPGARKSPVSRSRQSIVDKSSTEGRGRGSLRRQNSANLKFGASTGRSPAGGGSTGRSPGKGGSRSRSNSLSKSSSFVRPSGLSGSRSNLRGTSSVTNSPTNSRLISVGNKLRSRPSSSIAGSGRGSYGQVPFVPRGKWTKKSESPSGTKSPSQEGTHSLPTSPTKSPVKFRARSNSIERSKGFERIAAQYRMEYVEEEPTDVYTPRFDRIRRYRARHVPPPSNLWLVGNLQSFHSQVNSRYDYRLGESSDQQYYFFRSLPRSSGLPNID